MEYTQRLQYADRYKLTKWRKACIEVIAAVQQDVLEEE